MKLRKLFHLVCALLVCAPLHAQMPAPEAVRPAARPTITLSVGCNGAEQWERMFEQVDVRNVSCAALYPVLPKPGKANGRAVIVVPGGGYQFVSIDQEGFRVADALAAEGYSAFVLKYRTLPTPRDSAAYMAEIAKLFGALGKRELAENAAAVDDLAAALRMIQSEAGKRELDPRQIGVIGFSAGARTAIRLVEGRDEARQLANLALMYPPMSQIVHGGPRPPLFLAIAADDPLYVQGGLGLPNAWARESQALEFHLYAGGSHGFGMARKGTTSDMWIDQYLAWLARH